MTKNEKIKLGAAVGMIAVAAIFMIWYFFLSAPAPTPIETPPPEAPRPNTRTPGG